MFKRIFLVLLPKDIEHKGKTKCKPNAHGNECWLVMPYWTPSVH